MFAKILSENHDKEELIHNLFQLMKDDRQCVFSYLNYSNSIGVCEFDLFVILTQNINFNSSGMAKPCPMVS